MRNTTLPLIVVALLVGSCAKTSHTLYDRTTGNKIQETHLAGNYGIIPNEHKRGNLGDGGGGGLLGALLPGFNYKDDISRTFSDSDEETYIHIGADGSLTIKGPVDHGTAQDIQANAINRAVRNIATMIGWVKMLGVAEQMFFENEVTSRAVNGNLTEVQLQEMFTQEQLATIDADLQKALAEIAIAE